MRASSRSFVLALVVAVLWQGYSLPSLGYQQRPSAARQDPVIGTWRLNLKRSKYQPGPPPKSETRTYEPDGNAVKATIRRVLANGKSEVVEYTANYDNPHPVTGSDDIDRILMKRINDYTSESVLSHGGNIFGVARRVISPDGKTMTITLRREGNAVVNNVAFYERDAP
jgi:hypothetical protein